MTTTLDGAVRGPAAPVLAGGPLPADRWPARPDGRPHPGPAPVADRPGGAWAPYSPCGPECLPAAADLPRASRLRTGLRTAGLLGLLLGVAALAPLLPLVGRRARARWLRRVFRGVLLAAGVRLRATGAATVQQGAALVVANHLSWIDVLVLGAVQPVRMLAKREVRDWPVIGAIAARTGALFVDRAGLRTLPATIADVAAALRAGDTVGVFPEGTTWCGAASGPFRRAPFQAAIDAGAPVRPVAITLRLPGGRATTTGAFVGDQTLWDSLHRVLRLPALVCELTVLPDIVAVGADRRALAAAAQRAVASATGVVPAGQPAPVRPAPRVAA
ncbi:lysophospholipid acyltransferase family protein [Pseudonocardia acidicola]|uniref:1-acyl-sn-glycerol-3-phosphate acyltransferase n=1 Tax=Pseudonocardia acidicola TaxID=2724939 RepID=A0ABX1SI54_9PSEU|nr:lysophospholipid acyltransferase family protein [Pseudonocardia acidicola]NMI00741.1 1-acyl-sn-glycerol-3-phosphate acyltransferase [Pseudonocardia acidicola]